MKALVTNRTSSLSNQYSSVSAAGAPSPFGMGSAKTGVASSDASKRTASPSSVNRRTKTSSNTPLSSNKNLSLSSLPPDLIIKIFTFLPVPDLPRVAACSRRFKILVYNDDVYEHKLRVMMLLDEPVGEANEVDPAEIAAVSKLSSKLKQLPGGNMLPGGTKYLENGTMWDGLAPSPLGSGTLSTGENPGSNGSVAAGSTGSGSDAQGDLLGLDITNKSEGSAASGSGESVSAGSPQRITASIPQMKKSAITIGAGGLQAAGRTSSGASVGSIGGKRQVDPHKASMLRNLNGMRPRDAFRNMYSELCPYYIDFKTRQKDSKLFREHKDLIEIADLLRRLRLFSQAKFILDMDELNLSLETTIEWFESMVLGQFERAYDSKNVAEMRRNALACFHLNGGTSCINLFISKNPIFFDQTFNPSLIPNLVASTGGASGKAAAESKDGSNANPVLSVSGYALADEFAKFMDHLLTRCKEQASVVGKVFEPEMDAMTSFINKVFEDSITEYLSAVLVAAKERETNGIYLHTLATAVHCCTQFLEYIAAAEEGVRVQTEKVKEAITVLFKSYTDKYLELELKHLGKRFDNELKKWNNRKESPNKKKKEGAAYLGDAEKAQAHKRQVMSVMKTVLYAPMALGKTLALMGNGLIGGGSSTTEKSKSSEDLHDGDDSDDAVTYHLDDDSMGSLVSLELCLKLMHSNKEALGRTLVITSAVDPKKLRANVGKVFIKLLEAIGERHMRPAFENAISRLGKSVPVDNWTENGERSVNMDSLQFFELIHMSDLIHQMVDVYYAEDVRPWVDENDFLSDIMVEKKSFDRGSDDNVASGMDKSIQVLINQVDHIMNQMHLPADYNPTDSKMVFDLKPTKATASVIACLQAHVKLLQGSTHKDTLEVFLGEVGVRLFNVICKNLKKWQVSPTGAMQLICDFNRYHEWATTLRVPSVSRLFLVLKELGNLYMAEGGTELRNMVHDADLYQGALRPEEIYELLAARTDYKKIQKFVESKDCLVM
ncbi:F-box protein: endocytic membrane traffic, recycling ReCYcling 1 [Phlyctochytrium planicorne]|nr:F-box protein: endocytic membrane traffic, recycling ReCYcling 1 [Phlyctochytrium planicorne]